MKMCPCGVWLIFLGANHCQKWEDGYRRDLCYSGSLVSLPGATNGLPRDLFFLRPRVDKLSVGTYALGMLEGRIPPANIGWLNALRVGSTSEMGSHLATHHMAPGILVGCMVGMPRRQRAEKWACRSSWILYWLVWKH